MRRKLAALLAALAAKLDREILVTTVAAESGLLGRLRDYALQSHANAKERDRAERHLRVLIDLQRTQVTRLRTLAAAVPYLGTAKKIEEVAATMEKEAEAFGGIVENQASASPAEEK